MLFNLLSINSIIILPQDEECANIDIILSKKEDFQVKYHY